MTVIIILVVLGEGLDKEFKIPCNVRKNEAEAGFKIPDSWPSCKEPPPTTDDSTSSTTAEEVIPCQCVGDIPFNQARNILDKFCRNYTIDGNMWIYKATFLGDGDYEGYTPPSKKRCGSRNPESPELNDHCFCSDVEQQSSKEVLLVYTHTPTHNIFSVLL